MTNYELTSTNYPHPDITTGQHTNGPAEVWVKIDGKWIDTGSHSRHRVCRELERNGPSRIIAGTWNEYEQQTEPHHYGYCPQCGAPGTIRERRIDGDDICEKGHRYKSRDARSEPCSPS